MSDALLHYIFLETYTLNDLRKRIRLLKEYLESTFFSSETYAPQDTDSKNYQWFMSFIKNAKKNGLSEVTKDTLAHTFGTIEEEIKNIKPLVIFVPISIPSDELDKIGIMLRTSYGNTFFIDVKTDPLLIAGCAIAFKGIYKDYSVRQKFAENRQTILQSFQKYIH